MQKRYTEAEEIFRKAYSVDPSNLRGLLGLVEIQFQLGQPDQAIKTIADEAQKQPQRADLKKELANVELRAGHFDKAVSDYQAILDRYKDAPIEQAEIYFRISTAYALRDDYQKAIEYIQKAKKLTPTQVQYISALAQYQDAVGKQPEALASYREAMKIDPTNAVVLNNLAYLMSQTGGNLDEALTLAQRAKQQLPNFHEVSDTIGWIYIKKNLSDSAIEIFRDLTIKVKDNSTYHFHYGLALQQKGDKNNALKEFKLALQLKPKKPEEEQLNALIRKLT